MTRSWHLLVDASGTAELTMGGYPKPRHRRFNVSAQQLAELQTVVEREGFFGLADEYGEEVYDSSATVIKINAGGKEKTVTLRYLMNWVDGDPKRLREPARALRVYRVVRGWSDDDGAADAARAIAMILAAAEGRPPSVGPGEPRPETTPGRGRL